MELLAVIAILALLIIIALPNVLEMFNRVKKEIFLTEAKNLYKEVSKKYITENMRGNVINKIDSSDNKLNIDTDKLVYDIRLDDSGVIKDFKVSDGTYCIRSRINDIKSLTYELIEEGDCEGNPYAPEPVKCTYDGKYVTFRVPTCSDLVGHDDETIVNKGYLVCEVHFNSIGKADELSVVYKDFENENVEISFERKLTK